MAKFSPVLSLLAATVLLFGINLGLQGARADSADCIVAHSGPAPPGQHWDLRGKCWYLDAGPPLVHHAATRPRVKAATLLHRAAARRRAKAARRATSTAAAHAKSHQHNAHLRRARAVATAAAEARPAATAAVPVADAPPPAVPADGVRPQPHIEILRTVPVGVPTQEAAQPGAPAAPATRGGLATAIGNEPSPGKADAVASISGSGVKKAASAVRAAAPAAERRGSDAAQQKPAEAPGLANAIATQPTVMFFLLAIGLSMAVFLIAIAFRIAAGRRESIITVSPGSAWSSERLDPPQVDDTQFAGEATDEQWADEEQDVPFIDPQALASSTAAPSEPEPKGLEPLLRLLRQT